MKTREELAELIFPGSRETLLDLERKYPPRNVKGEVTRFAPSPTGFLHLGSLFTAFVARKVASDGDGVFFIRLEDTDTRRSIPGSGERLIGELERFGIVPDEGYTAAGEKGGYGPYIQSERAPIYQAVLKEMVRKGLAYPCFCTEDDLARLRAFQEKEKLLPGYYGPYAKCRNLTVDEAYERIEKGNPYVLRFRSHGSHLNKIEVDDLVRGKILIAENDLDVVIMKSDGLPTYHFAHVVDDHFMRTSLVIRGEEWIASAPIHVEMFKALGFPLPRYAHLPVIMKLEDGKRRKLSKRKDPEAAVSHFEEAGYPEEALAVYLMSIANSDFEEWTVENDSYDYSRFRFRFEKMPLDGILFDAGKLNYFGREIIARMSAEEVYDRLLSWTRVHDDAFYSYLRKYRETTIGALAIERGIPKARKDYASWRDVFPHLRFFYPEEFEKIVAGGYPFDPSFARKLIRDVLLDFKRTNDYALPGDEWFRSVKELGRRHGFAMSAKEKRKDPGAYVGHVGDVAGMLRVALAGAVISPSLHGVISVLGKEETEHRIDLAVAYLS